MKLALMPNPTPIPSRRKAGPASPVPEDKNVDCPLYRRCLDRAAIEDWAGFTCARCGLRDVQTEGFTIEMFADARRGGQGL